MSVGTSQSKSQHRSLSIASGIFLIVLGFSTLFASVLPMSPRLLISAGLLSGGIVLVAPRRARRLIFLLALFLSLGVVLLTAIAWAADVPLDREVGWRNLLPLFVICLLVSAGLLSSGLLLLAYLSSELVLRDHPVRELGRGGTVRQLLAIASGIGAPFFVIENGEVRGDAGAGILRHLGGPGLLIVRPGQAVVLEWGGNITGIWGPGLVRLRPFERVRCVVPLAPQWTQVEFSDVLTQDGVTLSSVSGVIYYSFPRARRSPAGAMGFIIHDDWYPTYRSDIERMLRRFPDPAKWGEAIIGVVETATRLIFGRHPLASLFPPNSTSPVALDQVSAEITYEARQQTLRWGLKVTGVEITGISLPEEIPEHALGVWVAGRDVLVNTARGMVDTERARTFEGIRLAVRQGTIRAYVSELASMCQELNLNLESTELERVAQIMALLMTRVAEDKSSGMRLVGAIERLMENPNVHLFIGFPDMGGSPTGQSPTITSDGGE